MFAGMNPTKTTFTYQMDRSFLRFLGKWANLMQGRSDALVNLLDYRGRVSEKGQACLGIIAHGFPLSFYLKDYLFGEGGHICTKTSIPSGLLNLKEKKEKEGKKQEDLSNRSR